MNRKFIIKIICLVWYNPFTEQVYEYPTYVQTWDGKLPVYGSLPTLFKGIE